MMLKGRRKAEEIIEEEEKQTVAETVVRTKTDRNPSGYYDGVYGTDPEEAYIDDRRMLTGTSEDVPEKYIPRLRGESARRAVEKGYSYTNIARAEILGRSTEKKTKKDTVLKVKK